MKQIAFVVMMTLLFLGCSNKSKYEGRWINAGMETFEVFDDGKIALKVSNGMHGTGTLKTLKDGRARIIVGFAGGAKITTIISIVKKNGLEVLNMRIVGGPMIAKFFRAKKTRAN